MLSKHSAVLTSLLFCVILFTKCSGHSGTWQLASGDLPCDVMFQAIVSPIANYSTNCTITSQMRVGGSEVPIASYCTAPGCSGTWQFLNNLTLYCCACNDATCDGLNYYEDDCTATGGYMATNDYGASFYCNVSSVFCGGELALDLHGDYICIDNTCTGSMVQQCPRGKTCLTKPPFWVCVDPSCPEDSDSIETLGMVANQNNTNWTCYNYCASGGFQYNMTSRQWECPVNSGVADGFWTSVLHSILFPIILFCFLLLCSYICFKCMKRKTNQLRQSQQPLLQQRNEQTLTQDNNT